MAAGAGQRLSLPGAATDAAGGADAGEGDRGALHIAGALRTLALQDTCAYCGKQGGGVKRYSICKQVWYCGTECQKAGWRRHKKRCAPPLSTNEVRAKVLASAAAREWRGVLEWEGRMEEMMEGQPDGMCEFIFALFLRAHSHGRLSTCSHHHDVPMISLGKLHIDVLGKMERFRDQGEAMCDLASNFSSAGKPHAADASRWLERARKVAEAHGFFSVECQACLGLGEQAMEEGRHKEGEDLLRNALAAVPLSEHDGINHWEIPVLNSLINALFETDAIEELEPLVLRHREAAKAKSAREGRLSVTELRSLFFSARLHEARGKPQEAARDVRALLDLLRQSGTAAQDRLRIETVLSIASSSLEILDPELGEEELIKSVATEVANIREMAGTAELH